MTVVMRLEPICSSRANCSGPLPSRNAVTTGYGAATKTANVEQGSTVAVFGVGESNYLLRTQRSTAAAARKLIHLCYPTT